MKNVEEERGWLVFSYLLLNARHLHDQKIHKKRKQKTRDVVSCLHGLTSAVNMTQPLDFLAEKIKKRKQRPRYLLWFADPSAARTAHSLEHAAEQHRGVVGRSVSAGSHTLSIPYEPHFIPLALPLLSFLPLALHVSIHTASCEAQGPDQELSNSLGGEFDGPSCISAGRKHGNSMVADRLVSFSASVP